MGQKQKTERKRGLNDGNNNGQATHGARKHAWRTQAAWAKILPQATEDKQKQKLLEMTLKI